jgi:outer membrane protein TolC
MRRRIKNIFILWLLLVAPLAFAEDVEKIDFHQALERAIQKSPDYDILLHNQKSAHLAFTNSWSVFLPELDAEAQNQYQNQAGNTYYNTATPLSPWNNLLALSVSENLYDNGKSWNDMDIAHLNSDIGDLSAQQGLQQLMLSVANAYYDFSSAFQSLDLQRQEIETLRRQYHAIEGRYQNGVNNNRDFLRIKAQVQIAEIGLATQEISLEDAKQTLRLAIGEKSAVDFNPVVPKMSEVESIHFPEASPDGTFEFRIGDAQDRVADVQYREVQREDWPRLTLKGNSSYNVPQYVGPTQAGGLDSPYWNVSAMLVLDYAIWDWGIRRRNVEIADNTRRVARDNQEKTRIQVRQALNRLGKENALYMKSFRESKQILHDEESVYASLDRGYRDGTVTYLDLITALTELYTSRNQFVSLEYELLKGRANVAYYQGNLDEILNAR